MSELSTHQLSCELGDRRLFHGLHFALKAGEILQVVGENGSGKTSLLRIIAGLASPHAGEVRWRGKNIAGLGSDYTRHLLYIGHQSAVKADLTVYENLQYSLAFSSANNTTSIDAAIASLGLSAFRDDLASQLSAGQQRRIALAKLLLVDAELWILDEPFAALDQVGASFLETLFAKKIKEGGLILLTSHQILQFKPIKKLELAR